MLEYWVPPIIAACCISMVMWAAWVYQIKKGDASLVDVIWAYGVGVTSVALLVSGTGDEWRRFILCIGLAAWSLRLGNYLLVDRLLLATKEDGRYTLLRESSGDQWPLWSAIFFQAQAMFVLIFSMIAWQQSHDPRPIGQWSDYSGIIIVLIAITNERIADHQLANWRSNPDNAGKTCRAGWWRFSRHPNYFFEWLHWCGWSLLAIGGPWQFVALAQPVLIIILLFRFTGIPYTEKQALRSRGDDYRRYQASTSSFFPWFPRKDPS